MGGILASLAEPRIEAALAEGQFDRLPGAGKPLQLEDESWVPQDWRLAFLVLQRAGYRPQWIETFGEIQEALARARSRLAAVAATDPARTSAEARFIVEAQAINRRIDDLNLMVPGPRWQLRRIVPLAETASLVPRLDPAPGVE